MLTLPTPLTPLIGREPEVAAVATLLRRAEVRLVTLSGPPGVGKTRLALQTSSNVAEAFSAGVCFIALAALTDPALVASAVAKALGLNDVNAGLRDGPLLSYLADKRLLLVLDNFEQVLPATSFIVEILANAPAVKILVTSRAVLHLSSEYEFPVQPLAEPDAVSLFTARAQATRADFQLTSESAPVVARVCRSLDGIPLAIELAAARSKVLTPQALLARLTQRLNVLTSGARDLPARQQTLRNAIAWSDDLLPTEAQHLLQQLSVFVGGFSLEAAEVICDNASLDGLSILLDHSLLRVIEVKGEPRFAMLEMIREYAADRLQSANKGQALALRQRHAEYFLELAERAERDLRGIRQMPWLNRLDAEHDNLRAALTHWRTTQEAENFMALAGALWEFWYRRGYLSEGYSWLKLTVQLSGPPELCARAICGAGVLARFLGDISAAQHHLEKSVQLWRETHDPYGLAEALTYLGSITKIHGEYARAQTYLNEALALWRSLTNQRGLAQALFTLGDLTSAQGDLEAARVLEEESLLLFRALDDKEQVALALNGLGEIARVQGNYGKAEALYTESLKLFHELGNRWRQGAVQHNLGYVALQRGEIILAIECFQHCLAIFRQLRYPVGQAISLRGFGAVALAVGRYREAARLLSITESIFTKTGASQASNPADYGEFTRRVAATREALGEAAFSAAWAEGHTLSLEAAFALVEELAHTSTTQPLPPSTGGPLTALTERETEVLRLVAHGLTYAQIAEKLVVSPRTVDAHLRSVYSKLGVNSRYEAARFALEHKLI